MIFQRGPWHRAKDGGDEFTAEKSLRSVHRRGKRFDYRSRQRAQSGPRTLARSHTLQYGMMWYDAQGGTMLDGTRRALPLILVASILHRAYGDSAIRSEKRHGGASDYQLCLESFDIHKDKIIRTQDSRDMGAKYLNVLDVDTRLDCLKYCCETEHCDVFIFEERVSLPILSPFVYPDV